MQYTKQSFFNFYSYQVLTEEEKELKLKRYKGFVLVIEIKNYMSFFQMDVNVFTFHGKENYYTGVLYTLNGLLDFATYQHTIWLENVDKATVFLITNIK
jgi:hypothetical protein